MEGRWYKAETPQQATEEPDQCFIGQEDGSKLGYKYISTSGNIYRLIMSLPLASNADTVVAQNKEITQETRPTIINLPKNEDTVSRKEFLEAMLKRRLPSTTSKVNKKSKPIALHWINETRWKDPIYVDSDGQRWVQVTGVRTFCESVPRTLWATRIGDRSYDIDGRCYELDLILILGKSCSFHLVTFNSTRPN
ncbi:hypothetical protein GOP47_0026778 [Adiantum capillus-veneris]|nr:hypothetical protein GOP47_0026778 [Adiantum capillus-veneris]